MYPEGYFTISTLEWPWIAGRRSAKSRRHADLVVVRNRSLVFRQMALGAKRHGATFASERSLKVMDIYVKLQLTWLVEYFVTNSTCTAAIFSNAGIFKLLFIIINYFASFYIIFYYIKNL